MMDTAKLFKSGRSQAVRLPKKYCFHTTEVNIEPTPDGLLLTEKSPWELFYEGISELPEDFMENREQPQLESRKF